MSIMNEMIRAIIVLVRWTHKNTPGVISNGEWRNLFDNELKQIYDFQWFISKLVEY